MYVHCESGTIENLNKLLQKELTQLMVFTNSCARKENEYYISVERCYPINAELCGFTLHILAEHETTNLLLYVLLLDHPLHYTVICRLSHFLLRFGIGDNTQQGVVDN